MATMAQLESALVKADAAGNTADAKALAAEIRRMRAASAPPAAQEPVSEIPQRTWTSAALGSVRNIPSSAAQFFGGIADVGGQLLGSAYTGEFPQFVTDLTDVAGGYIAKAIPERFIKDPQAAAALIAKADAFGGAMRDRYGSVEALKRTLEMDPVGFAADVSTLFAGGAGLTRRAGAPTGLTRTLERTATLTDPTAAIAPVISATVKGGARVAGTAADLVRGRAAELQAAEIARRATGNQLPAVLAATANAPADLTAAQAIYGINAPEFMALSEAARQADPAAFNEIMKLQGEDRINALAQLAGGYTPAQSRAAQAERKGRLTDITTPMREEALAAAGETGRRMTALEQKATAARVRATELVDRVRRFVPAMKTAQRWFETRSRRPGASREELLSTPERFRVRADEAAAESLRAGGEARAAENTAQSMRDRGLEPLRSGDFINSLRGKLARPEIALNPTTSKALEKLTQMMSDWTDQNGLISPEALYAIRKHGVAGVIEDLMPQASSKARRAATQEVLSHFKPMIDDAIVKAGGKNWKNYLQTFESGMQQIERQELASVALEMLRDNPEKFVKLVEGRDVKAVEKAFGRGSYDIITEMGTDFDTLRDIAAGVKRDVEIGKQAAEGEASLRNIIVEEGKTFRLPSFLSAKAAVTNKVLEVLEDRLSAKSRKVLTDAMKSGKSVNELLRALPEADQNQLLIALQNEPKVQAAVRRAAPAATAAGAVQNKLTETQIRNLLVQPW